MPVKIRPMINEDRQEIVRILNHTPEFSRQEVKVAGELIDAFLEKGASSDYHILVAVTDLKAVGYICYGETPLTEGTWDIYWIAVSPERKRQGLGHALLEAAEEKIREAGGRLVLIETSSQDEYRGTRDFYEDRGYGLIAHIPDFYTPGDDLIILRKAIKNVTAG